METYERLNTMASCELNSNDYYKQRVSLIDDMEARQTVVFLDGLEASEFGECGIELVVDHLVLLLLFLELLFQFVNFLL